MADNTIVAQLEVEPIGKDVSMADEVQRAVEVLEREGLKIDVGPVSTSMEARSLEDILDATHAVHRALIGRADRVVTHLTIDERQDKDRSMEERVSAAKPS